jgi:hypothetical protein
MEQSRLHQELATFVELLTANQELDAFDAINIVFKGTMMHVLACSVPDYWKLESFELKEKEKGVYYDLRITLNPKAVHCPVIYNIPLTRGETRGLLKLVVFKLFEPHPAPPFEAFPTFFIVRFQWNGCDMIITLLFEPDKMPKTWSILKTKYPALTQPLTEEEAEQPLPTFLIKKEYGKGK